MLHAIRSCLEMVLSISAGGSRGSPVASRQSSVVSPQLPVAQVWRGWNIW